MQKSYFLSSLLDINNQPPSPPRPSTAHFPAARLSFSFAVSLARPSREGGGGAGGAEGGGRGGGEEEEEEEEVSLALLVFWSFGTPREKSSKTGAL